MKKLLVTIWNWRRFIHIAASNMTSCIYRGKDFKVTSNGWVIVSDGESEDMLPLNYCSQELVDELEAHLKWWGYYES